MTVVSRHVFGISLAVCIGVTILGERLPAWWGPASILAMVLAATAFLTCSIIDFRRDRAALSAVEE